MFKSLHLVCPVIDMQVSLAFWKKLGFTLSFIDTSEPSSASYLGVQKKELLLHLQSFTAEQMQYTQTMALRIEMDNLQALENLYAEWKPHGVITADIGDRPWGNREFGFYDHDKTPFYFCIGI